MQLPVLALRDDVLLPGIHPQPVHIGRDKSLAAVHSAIDAREPIFVVMQRDISVDDPAENDLYQVGTIATIRPLASDEEHGTRKIALAGTARAQIQNVIQTTPYLLAEVSEIADAPSSSEAIAALAKTLRETFDDYVRHNKKVPADVLRHVPQDTDATCLAYYIAANSLIDRRMKQEVLQIEDEPTRLSTLTAYLEANIEILETEKQIRARVKSGMEKAQREYYLTEQLKAIQEELGHRPSSEPQKRAANVPIFRTRVSTVDKMMCFVLMPFSEKWSSRLYFGLIRPELELLGFQCIRADNLTGQIVIEDIWTKINQSGLIIADVTGRNPNVMYEVGIVHTLGKPAILLTQDLTDIPFDFAHLRHYGYEDNTEGFAKLSETLKDVVSRLYLDIYATSLLPTEKQ